MGVSIVIPSFERPAMLDRLLKSIQQQTYKDYEVIVVDDHSNNQREIESVIKKYSDLDLKFIAKDKRSGAPHSRNVGIMKAKYDLIALVDDDDEWFSKKLEKQVERFNTDDQKLGLVYTWTKVVNSNKNFLRDAVSDVEGYPYDEILKECFIPSPSVMVRKNAIIDSGLFDETLPSCQDWDMWTRLIFKDYRVGVCKEYLTYYYKHDGPTIGTSSKAKLGFVLYYEKHLSKLFKYFKIRHIFRYLRFKFEI